MKKKENVLNYIFCLRCVQQRRNDLGGHHHGAAEVDIDLVTVLDITIEKKTILKSFFLSYTIVQLYYSSSSILYTEILKWG